MSKRRSNGSLRCMAAGVCFAIVTVLSFKSEAASTLHTILRILGTAAVSAGMFLRMSVPGAFGSTCLLLTRLVWAKEYMQGDYYALLVFASVAACALLLGAFLFKKKAKKLGTWAGVFMCIWGLLSYVFPGLKGISVLEWVKVVLYAIGCMLAGRAVQKGECE